MRKHDIEALMCVGMLLATSVGCAEGGRPTREEPAPFGSAGAASVPSGGGGATPTASSGAAGSGILGAAGFGGGGSGGRDSGSAGAIGAAAGMAAVEPGHDPAPIVPDGTGLLGEYFDGADFSTLKASRVDATVDFDWGTGSPDPAIGVDSFSVRWTGQILPTASETYTFYAMTDDGVRLWVDGEQLVDNWVKQWPKEESGTIELTAGQKYAIVMEYYEDDGEAIATLSWSSPDIAKQIIPQVNLFPAAAADIPDEPPPDEPPGTRDPLKWPFAQDSIWNMPIGSDAVYKPANMPAVPSGDVWASMPQIDDEKIVLRPKAPLIDVNYSDAGWSRKDRCVATGGLLTRVPVPSDYLVPNGNGNSSAVFLMPDGRSLIHTQPFTRCTAGGPATSLVKWDVVDLYGDGRAGSHGGSGLSALGGALRIGELRPGGAPPRHALKVAVDSREVLYPCKVRSECFRWPAFKSDSGSVGTYGSLAKVPNPAMKMGSLLALPASTDLAKLGLETEPAKQLAWTLQNYGAYIVDSSGGPAFYFNAENGADGSMHEQFQIDWGFPLQQRVRDNTPWVHDVQRLVTNLYVVDNNGPTSIGGGGTPRQPLAPPIGP